MTPQQAADFLRAHDNYLILTHVRPDGDTVGCAAGLCLALRQAGKTAHVLPNPETTSLFSPYLEGLLDRGYRLEHVVEPQPTPEMLSQAPEMAEELRRPMMLIVSAQKPEK